ncbi:MAG TPA: hypothetical protein DCM38_03890 [Gammaproteobacteria bacterium]|jgi:hypothetical protein|nr:hypothetical protein [Candidatus Parabeggiatoa sp.]HAI68562.1 hypothetical protein [Gammaproteobacteria bacterium]
MSNTTTKKAIKKALIGATVLASAPAFAKTGGGSTEGKSQLGVNHLSLDLTPGRGVTACASDAQVATKTGSNLTPNDLILAVDPFASTYIEVGFHVRDIIASKDDHVLLLVYSPTTSPSPQIPTPKSENKLQLDVSALEILAIYNLPKQAMLSQPSTRLGAANPAPHSEVSFSVNLDTSTLPVFMQDNEKAHLQAALLTKSAFEAGQYDRMILSELDTIAFVKMTCPTANPDTNEPTEYAEVAVDDAGTMTVSDKKGNVTKTTMTGSMSMGATVITK